VQAATEVEIAPVAAGHRSLGARRPDRRRARADRRFTRPRTGAGARLEVVTPRAVTGVRGTTFRIGSSGETGLVEVLTGAWKAAAQDGSPRRRSLAAKRRLRRQQYRCRAS
jgi:hypothetical protein